MDYLSDIETGPFEARYRAFLETVTHLRPRLHRYCTRMTGSVMDGEDVVQEALFEAYRKLDQFDDSRPLGPWLFRIAHNRCIDFLRRRNVRQEAEAEVAAETPESVMPVDPSGAMVHEAVEHLVISLPPKERACVLLKDVFDYSLEEIAEMVDSTVGGVKAALSRGRAKLKTATAPMKATAVDPEVTQLLELYAERFNRHDWDGLRELISADARLRLADIYSGRLSDTPYFWNYERWPWPWKLAAGEVDGEPAVIILRRGVDAWEPYSAIRLEIVNHRVAKIFDYLHTPWLLGSATSTVLSTAMDRVGDENNEEPPSLQAQQTCCPIVELRQYTLHPGKREVLIELFDREFIESQEALGMNLVGQFRDLNDPDRFVWLRGFRDMPSRARALEDFYGGPVWKAHRQVANATMIDSDNVLLLRAAHPGSEFLIRNDRPRPGAKENAKGLVVATIYYFDKPVTEDFISFFEGTVKPVLTEAGSSVLAYFVTEHSANTFPRLPVREGENVFVWFSIFQDQAAYADHETALSRSKRWRTEVSKELADRLKRSPEVLKLSPTARSRLRS